MLKLSVIDLVPSLFLEKRIDFRPKLQRDHLILRWIGDFAADKLLAYLRLASHLPRGTAFQGACDTFFVLQSLSIQALVTILDFYGTCSDGDRPSMNKSKDSTPCHA